MKKIIVLSVLAISFFLAGCTNTMTAYLAEKVYSREALDSFFFLSKESKVGDIEYLKSSNEFVGIKRYEILAEKNGIFTIKMSDYSEKEGFATFYYYVNKKQNKLIKAKAVVGDKEIILPIYSKEMKKTTSYAVWQKGKLLELEEPVTMVVEGKEYNIDYLYTLQGLSKERDIGDISSSEVEFYSVSYIDSSLPLGIVKRILTGSRKQSPGVQEVIDAINWSMKSSVGKITSKNKILALNEIKKHEINMIFTKHNPTP